MRILYSHRTRSADGQAAHIRGLTEALEERGHQVIMTDAAGRDAGHLNAGKGWRMRAWLPAPVYECAEYGYSWPAFLRLSGLARKARPDVVYERYNLFYHAGVWLRRRTGLPLLLEINAPLAEERAEYGGLFWKSWARASERMVWRAADAALAVSGVLASRLRAAGVEDEKIHVVQNGVGSEFLRAHDGHEARARYGLQDKLVLGFSGFMREWHGLERVLRFMAAQGRADLHFLIVGDGPARPGLEHLAQELGVAAQLTITGVVQRNVLPGFVAAFDVALQPGATAYASPLKLLEYMALGRAILAPDQANIRELLTDGEDALLFDPDAPGAFDRALLTLVDSRDLRGRLGAAARACLIRRDFTWSGAARRVEAIAAKLLESRA